MNFEDKFRVYFGGVSCSSENPHPKHLAEDVLTFSCDFKFSPLDSLKANFKEAISFCLEYFKGVYDSERHLALWSMSKISVSALIRRFVIMENRVDKFSYDELVQNFYDLILSLDGLATLKGFGVGNKFGDVLYGNPEKVSLYWLQENAKSFFQKFGKGC